MTSIALRGEAKSMTIHLTKAPHQGAREPLQAAPNAALLIDFDNVTMGMRSDLSKELKSLLNSDIIKGKVTVQRAYADWRRYPQYIVPLSEASIDLIFAPAYGSNKKNATDIRMAIDGIELVFIRPEIGVFILLTGDSDFSSLVLKLKEYGKYVIGVGIQESSSDILVQNCDEYYSYTSLSGLRKTTDADRQPVDPWVLVEQAVDQMAMKGDVMRSDRLKQVMVELDPGFDEGEYGFSKFSRFLTDAFSKGLVRIRKLDNGQYEVAQTGRRRGTRGGEDESSEDQGGRSEGRGRARERDEERGRSRSDQEGERRGRERGSEGRGRARERSPEEGKTPAAEGPPLEAAYDLLRRALGRLLADGREAVRDSDVKRKMLELDGDFDESQLGFSKFSRFLRQAHDHEVVELRKRESGNYEVSLRGEAAAAGGPVQPAEVAADLAEASADIVRRPDVTPRGGMPIERKESAITALGRRFGLLPPRRPEERAAPAPDRAAEPLSPDASRHAAASTPEGAPLDPSSLGLPTDSEAQVRYLTNRYRGVGKRTAEKLVEGFGGELFTVLQTAPERVQDLIPPARAENVLEQWRVDYDRRRTRLEGEEAAADAPAAANAPATANGPATANAPATANGPATANAPAAPDAPAGVPPQRREPTPAPAAEDAAVRRVPDDLAGLEPSRLHSRTSRRGRRR